MRWRWLPQAVLDAIKPEAEVPAMLVLVAQDAPSRTILCAGAGTFEAAHITMTRGAWIGGDAQAPERLLARLSEVIERSGDSVPRDASAQGTNEVTRALKSAARGA